ncbi:16S rRNA (cytidine(1402)-2'-O)-methyltransferase [Pontibacillus yanchengensis]|uniref:16S rRNA (Cytidine(1402)-2'-O)-methyltransferase n=2 Tax=Pontibacillus yanchengensis TaxID=462910 RepID=A0ACC7VLV6_9BACI|nr:16S rRNA (cytidine(1402)-2'-O)-methyltransferase [Pontibacillus yanchengensis]MYL35935.1 16S rRNA (cytidine(1402)-2'-O)-methyltransferase [Pontibacillus yanchengensis]MYL55803.1 16S rRNA (cytidine(1402)-2'-O)-methyltransferase [Pontibacillus yanchengensis]
MNIQKSYQIDSNEQGVLYIVPTPIGNLEDITYRALRTLEEVDQIAAEDTRQTKKLLSHFDIHTPLISYHEHNKYNREDYFIEEIQEGKTFAIVSDAGMPGVSDPGYEMVQAAISNGIKVIVLPGANAALCALVGSGLDTSRFFFYGFLPRKKKERKEELEKLQKTTSTILFYESPHRLKEVVKHMYELFGERHMVLARELTKKYEEFIRGTTSELLAWVEENEIRGEFCIIVEGNLEEEIETNELWWSHLSLVEHVEEYVQKQYTSKEAIKKVAQERKLPKREVYQAYHT